MNDNFSKKYGQVFLKDHNIALKEVSFLSPEDNECILEIGPGHGILTEQLLKYNINLTVVEPDHRFVDQLNQSYNNFIKSGKLKIIKADFLKLAPGKYDKIIGNIPYQISSKIIFKILDYDFKMAILMVQKEFAQRLVASPGTPDYSRLTVNSGIRSQIKILYNVSRNSFYPVPNVDSSIILIEKREYNIDIKKFDLFLIKLFSMRRKKISSIIDYHGIYSDKRPYELTIDQLIEVYSQS
ncbi:16S rRNA (adenine(1518)-N(6)/adenine(1519)-N(6))-dimethyltransferase RsmA [Acidiplasma cupricumulans]|jgi:16S rRNA (adenine1518-N6/adenine1519-N6)-dimethyltransferase|uniref:Ribosomal RNA adenine methylase transferase N-terminal domain-containing protein n=1 Tax=Acidiplasma cupricumulans TaxID=312540 RepID=A0A0Q1B8G2_9ARCH|nr:16S rRNA (adenine(1518)-N(6)/adenine(1519)-N(6))-dimethyltransferase RsmA [Acidiplasma cupricumulans]KQB36575.1 hypothetical protein AOG55_03640 [Acidiplasma cupricumulans]